MVAVRQLGGVGLLQDVHLQSLAALPALQMLLVLLVVLCQVLCTWQAKNGVTSLASECSLPGPVYAAGENQYYNLCISECSLLGLLYPEN